MKIIHSLNSLRKYIVLTNDYGGKNSCELEFNVAHINFIVLALVDISNRINLAALEIYLNMQTKKPTLIFHSRNYRWPLHIIIKK